MNIRLIEERDWPRVWNLMEPVIRAGETYPYARDMLSEQAHRRWLDVTEEAYLAEDAAGDLLGTYYIKPNQPTLGAHVANCGYMVAARARGQGVATALCKHSQSRAVALGYRAMQFNLVVKTNAPSVHLWQKLGYHVVGTLPGAFLHARHGYVDAYVMFRTLVD